MKIRIQAALAAIIAAGALAGCENMTRQEKSVATGAAVGGVAGAALTVGNEVAKRRGY